MKTFKTIYYIEREGKVVPEPNVQKWREFMSNKDSRVVDRTDLLWGGWVSTVFLGLDHTLGFEAQNTERPIVYETMVFADMQMQDMDMDRYCTREEAKAGHERMVQKWQTNPPIEELHEAQAPASSV